MKLIGNLLFGFPRGLSALSGHRIPFNSNYRKNINIAVIDDSDFAYADLLRKNGFQITTFKDIETVKVLEGFQIILCDIKGVGLLMGAKDGCGGVFLLSEINKSYPDKILFAYTGSRLAANDSILYADKYVAKDIGIDKWIDMLDSYIEKLLDPSYLWMRVRERLLNGNTPLYKVLLLEESYISGIVNKRQLFSNDSILSSLSSETKELLKALAANAIYDIIKNAAGSC